MPDPDQIAAIDLDGTVADYDSDMRVRLETIRSPDEPQLSFVAENGTNGEAVRARLQRAFERKRGEAL